MLAAMMLAVWLRNKTLAMVVIIVYQVIVEPIIRLALNSMSGRTSDYTFPCG